MGDAQAQINEKYLAMRSAESKKAMEWMSLFNSNPELAINLIPLFDMPSEDVSFIIRTLNSMYDSLYFYRMAVTSTTKKKPSRKVVSTLVSM